MRNLITIVSLAAALYLGWQYNDLTTAKTAAEAKTAEMTSENQSLKTSLKAANARIEQLTAPGGHPVLNWLQQRNQNWKSPLTSGSLGSVSSGGSGRGRQHGAVPTPAPTPFAQQPMYYTDAQGRYYFDANGVKHYVQ